MLLWKYVAEQGEARKIDEDEGAAREWVRLNLRHCTAKVRENGKWGTVELFDWKTEWPEWKANFQALLWLAKHRDDAPDRKTWIPRSVTSAVDGVLRPAVLLLGSDYLGECKGFRVALTDRNGDLTDGPFRDLAGFWQAVFLSYFQPEAVSTASVCQECGEPLPATRKSKRPSKARHCKLCAHKIWRREHPEEIRKLWREQKKRDRSG